MLGRVLTTFLKKETWEWQVLGPFTIAWKMEVSNRKLMPRELMWKNAWLKCFIFRIYEKHERVSKYQSLRVKGRIQLGGIISKWTTICEHNFFFISCFFRQSSSSMFFLLITHYQMVVSFTFIFVFLKIFWIRRNLIFLLEDQF